MIISGGDGHLIYNIISITISGGDGHLIYNIICMIISEGGGTDSDNWFPDGMTEGGRTYDVYSVVQYIYNIMYIIEGGTDMDFYPGRTDGRKDAHTHTHTDTQKYI